MGRLTGNRILITGGCGFIGSHLVHALWQDNEVIVVDDLSSGELANLEGCQVQLARRSILDDVDPLFDGVGIVFHTAANVAVQGSIDNPVHDVQTNVEGTVRVLEASRRHNVRRFVYSASSAVYGEAASLPIREDHPAQPDSPYAVSKWTSEQYCRLYHELYHLPTISLRYFNVYGPRQRVDGPYSGVIAIFAQQIADRQPLTIYGDGTQTRDFVAVQDVVRANLLAAQADFVARGQAINIGTGAATRIIDLAHIMGSAACIHARERAGDARASVADLTLARKTLGFRPGISLVDGLRAYQDWRKENGRLRTITDGTS